MFDKAYCCVKYFFCRSFSAIDGKKGTITEGKPAEGTTAQVTITVSDDDFIDLAMGKANAPAVRRSSGQFVRSAMTFVVFLLLALCQG